MNTKLILKSLLFTAFLFFVGSLLPAKAIAAPRIYFDPNAQTVASGQEFELNIKIDTGSISIFGAEMVLDYPGGNIEVVTVSNGNFFGTTTYANNAAGRLEIRSYFSNLFEYKSGSGTVAVIKLRSKTASGSDNISFLCSSNGSDTFILDEDGANVLSCSSLNQATITYSSTDNGSSNGTGGDDSGVGEPNSCGGTCGSNYNCKSEFFCYQGFCRSPTCPDKVDCNCGVATTPPHVATPKPTRKPIAKVSPTPQVVTLSEATPTPSPPPIDDLLPSDEESEKTQSFFEKYQNILLGIGCAIFLGVFVFLIKKLISRKKPPIDSSPPTTTISNVEPPLPADQSFNQGATSPPPSGPPVS